MSSATPSVDEWCNLDTDGRLSPQQFAGLLASSRYHYMEAVRAAREWRTVSDAIQERYDDGTPDGRIKVRQAMIESITLRDHNNRRDFHLMMHRLVADQMALEFNYQMFVEDSTVG